MGEFKKAKKDFEDEIQAGEEQGREEWEKKKTDKDDTHPAVSED